MSFWVARAERFAKRRDVAGLLALFDDPREKQHERAIAATSFIALATHLGSLRPQVVAALLRSADNDCAYVRRQALFALGELRAPEALEAFRRAARDADWIVRLFGAHGLDRLGDPRTLEDAVRMVGDRESQVREAAVCALASIGDPRVRPLLDRVARADGYESVREAATEALTALRG